MPSQFDEFDPNSSALAGQLGNEAVGAADYAGNSNGLGNQKNNINL